MSLEKVWTLISHPLAGLSVAVLQHRYVGSGVTGLQYCTCNTVTQFSWNLRSLHTTIQIIVYTHIHIHMHAHTLACMHTHTRTQSIPVYGSISIHGQLAKLSQQTISFGRLPLFSAVRRLVFVSNNSPHTLSYQWDLSSELAKEVCVCVCVRVCVLAGNF